MRGSGVFDSKDRSVLLSQDKINNQISFSPSILSTNMSLRREQKAAVIQDGQTLKVLGCDIAGTVVQAKNRLLIGKKISPCHFNSTSFRLLPVFTAGGRKVMGLTRSMSRSTRLLQSHFHQSCPLRPQGHYRSLASQQLK